MEKRISSYSTYAGTIGIPLAVAYSVIGGIHRCVTEGLSSFDVYEWSLFPVWLIVAGVAWFVFNRKLQIKHVGFSPTGIVISSGATTVLVLFSDIESVCETINFGAWGDWVRIRFRNPTRIGQEVIFLSPMPSPLKIGYRSASVELLMDRVEKHSDGRYVKPEYGKTLD